MASLQDAVKDCQNELRDGIAWVVFWREGRSWNSDYLYLELGSDTISYDDIGKWKEISSIDPRAVALNGYYCGHLAEDMRLDELTAGVRWHYENGFNSLAGFIEQHDGTIPPEQIEAARQTAHAAGLPFSERPYDGQELNPYVYDGSMTPEDYELMHTKITEERKREIMSYSTYDHDKLEAAENMRIERKVYFETDKADISALAGLPLEQLQTMREESEAAEQAVFADLQKRAAAWEEQAGKTLEIKKAIEYVRTPPVKHTSNEWEQRDPDYFVRSNSVYRMYYRINENTRYDSQKQASVPYSWTLTWGIHTNGPDTQQRAKIAGQTRKVFADKADMEKYLNGRIKAYQHLFTELSPPVPQQYADHFKVSGHLLPGYTIEGQEPEQAQLPQQDNEQPEAAASQSAAQPEQAAQEAAAAEPRPVVPILFASKDPAEKMKEITGRLEQGIQGVFESERYRDYLNTMSKFHHYSFNNTMLIALQGGQFVRGYNQWKTDFDRHVKAEENGIKILAPAPYKVKQNVRKIDPETKKPVLDGDGKPVMEEKEITVPSYKVVSVFDVSQTEGKEMPPLTLAQPLIADVAQYEDFFKAIEKASPFPISFEPLDGERKGGCLYDERRIVINEGMSQLQNVKTAIHEAAHAKLHDIGSDFFSEDTQDRPDRRTREVQAESIAYAVCQNFGLDVSDYSFAYLADWSSGKELTELKSSLETIHRTAKELITEIEGHFTELQKAREATEPQRDEAAPEQQPQEQPEQAAQEAAAAEPTVTVIWSESAHLQDGQTMSLSEADKLFASLDAANKDSPGYDKTKFSIDYVLNGEARNYEGRQDFGDGEGGLIEHIEKYHTRYVDNPDWDNYLLRNEGKEALEADKAEREILLHEVVPYLKLHCKLSEMEQAAQRLLTVENLSPAETALYNAIQKHVTECRGMLNRGEYDLPPVPSYGDFDPDLQTYKQHVMDEITQEAASAGMTVEEYAANGYEPYPQTQDAPVFNRLPPEKQQALSDTVKATLQMFIEADQRLYGDVTDSTLEAIAVQGYSYRDGKLEKLTAAEPEQAAQEAAAAAPEQTTPTAEHLTDLQKKAVEIAQRYENLSMQDKIGIIAQAFGGTSGEIETSPCTGKWRGTSDISIKFDNGASLFIGNHSTPKAKTAKIQNECVNAALVQYNPEIISAAKETAITSLVKREAADNEIAAQKGLKPYTVLNVEFNDGTDDKISGYMGWYYVTLAVDGKICSHIETGLNHDIADGKVSEAITRDNFYPAGALKEADVDYVFNNVGFSSASGLYSLHISDAVRERAEKTLAEREAAAEPEQADSFTIYQLKGGDETRDYRFEPYDRLRAVGLAVDPANYEQTYTAPLESGMTLERIFERFNIDRPADFTGHSLSVSDVVVLHQNGQDTAHYVDSIGYKEVPEFLKMPEKEITPDDALTGEAIKTPRGTFRVTDMTKEQIEAAGYGFHHQSDDGKYLIMANGTRAFAISAEPPQRENPLQAAEQTTEQNENMIDGIINNTPPEAAAPAADTPTYYHINEAAARHANDMNSYRDYRQGSATAGYRQAVDEAAAIAKRQKERVDPMYHDKIDSLLDTYARKLADNMNKSFAIEGRVASILVAGGSNFPVRKKEKQNAARDKNMEEWRDIQGLLDKIRSTGMGGISADDPQAVQKLEKKLAGLEQLQEKMKAVNAYYRKHKTLDGCPHLSPESIEKVKAGMSNGWRVDDKPYPSWALSNNNAEIRRVKERITALTQRSETPFVGWEFDGGKVEANRQDNRLQIFFDGKPDADTRSELKSSGFRWSPSEGAWQRQLNDNAIYAADGLKCIRPITGERPTEIQRKARAAAKEQKPSVRAQLAAAKEQAQEQPKKQPDKSKSKEMEV